MELVKSCPSCGSRIASNSSSCRCGWAEDGYDKKSKSDDRTGQICSWSHEGRRCVCRGIISQGTNGDGKYFCREHWSRLMGDPTDVLGNSQPAPATSRGVTIWHEEMEVFKSRRGAAFTSKPVEEFKDGETVSEFLTRMRIKHGTLVHPTHENV